MRRDFQTGLLPAASGPGSLSPASSSLRPYGIDLPEGGLDRNNAISVFLMGALPPVAGSAISILLGVFFAWGLISLVLGRFDGMLTRLDRQLAVTFTVFAALIFATGLISNNRFDVFPSTVWLLPYLSLWVIIPRLRASPGLNYLNIYILGATVGCLAGLALATFEIAWLEASRPEGGAGNSAVFAIVLLCLAGMAGLAIDAKSRTRRLWAAVAVLAGFAAVALSMTRGVILAIPIVTLILVFYAPRRWLSASVLLGSLAVAAVLTGLLTTHWDTLGGTIASRVLELGDIRSGEYTFSVSERLRLWQAGWAAFQDSPLAGYGIQNRMQALVPFLAQDDLPIRMFTHPHNGFLAFALDGGVIALGGLIMLLVMPVAVALQAPMDSDYRKRVFLALVVVITYVVAGMTQILFKHDIMDSLFIFTAVILSASIPRRAPDGVGPELS